MFRIAWLCFLFAFLMFVAVLANNANAAGRTDCAEIEALMSPIAPSENLYNSCDDVVGDIYNPGDGQQLEIRDNAGNVYAHIDPQGRARYVTREWKVDSLRDLESLRYRVGVTAYTNFVKYQGYQVGVHRNALSGTIHGTMRWSWNKLNSTRRVRDAVKTGQQQKDDIE